MIEGMMSQAAATMQGELQGRDAAFRGVGIDSRTLGAGQLFVAIKGPNFDGIDYLPQAAAAGAAGAVAARRAETRLPLVVVAEPRRALGDLAREWRTRMQATVIGLTGSNGKTTCKELLASCLSPTAATLATDGNLNNDLGLPLMLSRLGREHRYAVLEMGANHAREIAYLAALAEPSIVIITNAGPAHLEGFGSLEGVARAKGEILEGRTRPRTAVLNADDGFFDFWRSLCPDVDVLSFGHAADADVRIANLVDGEGGTRFRLELPAGAIDVDLPLPGAHNAQNAAAAAAAAVAAGLTPKQVRAGLEAARPVAGRLKPLPGRNGVRLFDDSYNANPASVVAAARYVAAQPGRSVLVLGDMGELGAESESLHRAVGEGIREAGVGRLLATGPLSRQAAAGFGAGADWFATVDDLLAELEAALAPDLNVLVKGSRSMRMERVVAALANGEGG